MRKKLAITFAVIVLALFALSIRIVYLNVTKGDDYSITVLRQQGNRYNSVTMPYKRGEILDRNGTPVATSIKGYNLVIDPAVILSGKDSPYLDPTVDTIEKYFKETPKEQVTDEIRGNDGKLDAGLLKQQIAGRNESHYWVVIRQLSYGDIKAYEAFMRSDKKADTKINSKVKGVTFEDEYRRSYPFKDTGCDLIGFVNKDGSASLGIEAYYNEYLTGVNGRRYGYVNADSSMERVVKSPENGDTIVSTIDINVQRIVQKKIKEYRKKYKPERLAAVIADPDTGEILAMADDTSFNLNDPRNLSGLYKKSELRSMSAKEQQEALNNLWHNFCITDAYEPGSTAKPFTAAAAYEEGVVNKKSTFVCDGQQQVGGFTIGCNVRTGHGTVTVKDAVAQSCNDAMMQIGAKLGAKLFSQYQTRFGFGYKTGIDLPGETAGLTYTEEKMGASTLATNSFGQNFTVNMVQMTAAFSSLINGGYYYEPRVVKEIRTDDGSLIENFSKNVMTQTVTADTSAYVRDMLRAVVTEGTGKKAAIENYTVGGKTGTAEKVSKTGQGHAEGEYILSFIGCVPCENPEIVCYTLMDTPKDDPDSTEYSLDFWTGIMKDVLPYLHVQRTGDSSLSAS